ncbi:MAG: ferric reductase-like transmembrane domain-containing protein [Colwellia sp.]|nr:ferric reductase-like transmembrane domain-containing protein [Colwellia sp.]
MIAKYLSVIAKNWLFYFMLAMIIITCTHSRGLGAGIAWNVANGLGYAAFTTLLLTCFSRPVRLNNLSHRSLGYVTLLFTSLHISILLISDPVTIEYLKPNAPLYMWLGSFSAIFMVFIIISSLTHFKNIFYNSTGNFKKAHRIMSWLIVIGCLCHIIVSGFYISQQWQIMTLIIVAIFSLWPVNIKRLSPINIYYLAPLLMAFMIIFIGLWGWSS